MMDVYAEVLKERYMKPIYSLVEGLIPKAIIAFFVTGVDGLLGAFYDIFTTDIMLIQALFTLIIIDWITGIIASMKANRRITSIGMRSTIVKAIEYALFLAAIIILSNLTEALNWIQVWVFVYMSATEVKSIAENLFDDNRQMQQMLQKLWEEFQGKGHPDVKD